MCHNPFLEVLRYNDTLTLLAVFIPWVIGIALLFDKFVIRPIIWCWHDLWKGMDAEARYEIVKLTFKSARW
jgi:hypothetical protein